MATTRRGIATGGKPYITVAAGRCRISFLSMDDFRRHKAGAPPKGYRPTLGQQRLGYTELRTRLQVFPGGKA